MSKFKAVRCGSSIPTPYLRKHIDVFTECVEEGARVVDIGCGEGRNSRFLKEKGMHVMSLDGKGDYGVKWMADQMIPICAGTADLILCNYFLMFLPVHTRNDVYDEMDRIAHKGTRLLIELDMIKQSLTPDAASLKELNGELQLILCALGWKVVQQHKNRYIFEKAA